MGREWAEKLLGAGPLERLPAWGPSIVACPAQGITQGR